MIDLTWTSKRDIYRRIIERTIAFMFTWITFFLFSFSLTSWATDISLEPGNLAAVLEQARKAPKPVHILVKEGVHPIMETITLGKDDSQVTWSGKNAVFMAGKPISGWVKEGAMWKATLPDKAWKFEQLWINGRRATLARSPNKGYHHITEAVGAGVFPDLKENMNFHAFSIPTEQFNVLKSIPQAERDDVLLTVTHAWAVGQCRIKALNDEALAVQIKGRARYPFVEFEPDQRFWMENYRAALDAPGEWFLDKAKGEVLYLPVPGEDMTKAEVIAPMVEKFIVMKGAHDVRFEGISFQYSQHLYPADGLHDGQAATTSDGCIEIEDSRGIHFENCEIAHTGLHGVWFKNGCSDSSVKHCQLHDLGGGGVYVGETGRPNEERVNHHIVVDDCIMQHGGRLHPSACGVVFTHTQHCAVTHCDIADFYYTGISAGWNWGYGDTASRETLVENNHIHHLGWAYLSDMGGFYGLGTSPGTIIRGNHVHHIASHRYGGWGLYNDEGATDTLMENNLVHDTWNAGFHQHYGYFNTVRNNIFAFGNSAQIQASRNEARLRFRYLNNIVVWEPEVPLLDGGEWNWKFLDKIDRGDPKDSLIFRKNLYWPTDGKIPAKLTKSHFTWEEWRKMGRDSGSQFADPLFEDINKRDFRLKAGSPAEKIGFKPWDLTLAGVRKTDVEWQTLAAKGHDYPNWQSEAKPWPSPPYQVDKSFETTALDTIGIRNAQYTRENKGDSIGVTDAVGSPIGGVSKRSLKVQDAPGLRQSYEPVLDIHPKWEAGTFSVSFDLMIEPEAAGFFEMRAGAGGEFAAGPYLRWQKGTLVANNPSSVKLADLKPGTWVRVQITATTGVAKYNLTLTQQDGTVTQFPDLPCKPTC
jgi:hypothetical protein